MAKYNWEFANIGGNSRIKIQSGEDLRHLGELDQKLWTVLSCPTKGLEIDDKSLALLDTDGDGRVRVNEVIAASQWLCNTLTNPDELFESKAELELTDIADADILAIAQEVAGEKTTISIADVEAAIAGVTVEQQAAPEVPFADYADIKAAYESTKDAYGKYFKDEHMQKLGLIAIPEDVVAPKIKEADWAKYGAQIAEYEAACTAVADTNKAALDAATAKYQPLRKLLYLNRDFYTLLRNYITFEDFYGKDKKAIFQAGTLIIDQRACDLCVRVEDMGKHNTQAPASGMYLLYCTCTSKTKAATMDIVAVMTMGDIHNLMVGKNAIFYDRSGQDWDAVVTKIVDNPISIKQAFWSPYRKFANWIKDLINKSAAEKESKGFEDMKAKATETTATTAETAAADTKKAQAFDIAKFAGIFAAIGMAVGFIGSFLTSLAMGLAALKWWQFILVFFGIILVISGPSMFIAWLKLRRRNLAPILNANGWAINAEAIVNVPFGKTLTQEAQFPLLNGQKGMKPWQKWCIAIATVLVLGAAGYCIWKFVPSHTEGEAETELVDTLSTEEAAPVE